LSETLKIKGLSETLRPVGVPIEPRLQQLRCEAVAANVFGEIHL